MKWKISPTARIATFLVVCAGLVAGGMAAPASGDVFGFYRDFELDAVWEDGDAWGYYQDYGIARLAGRRFVAKTDGYDNTLDRINLRLDRRIVPYLPFQRVYGVGKHRMYDYYYRTWSRGSAQATLDVFVDRRGRATILSQDYDAYFFRGWWRGLFVYGDLYADR